MSPSEKRKNLFLSVGFFPTSQFVLAYVIMGCLCCLLHLGRGKWFDAEEDFDYI
ncbi:hypothetical protein [Desulfoluna sp.]|uniref:hypothetical protein n=1 Tax=Desulfoluna sp. TaxID=2045199 RepID=UPI002601FFC1|nr:hypothetical protein [Desulfoluna sp.]